MPGLTQDLREVMDYFAATAMEKHKPATEELIHEVETQLNISLPPSMKAFLQVHNGLGLIDHRLLSVPDDVLKATTVCREVWGQENWVVVAWDGSGDSFVLLGEQQDERGEYPVAKIDHETGQIMFVVGSTYERFVWFLLDKLRRGFTPDGSSKNLWYAADDDEDEDDPYFPWPYQDKAWMVERDPGLVKWLTGKPNS